MASGKPGGEVNILVASARDTRLMTLYSNSRLIVYDDQFKLQPDILESYEAKDNREFTLKLRAGHKWSDGKPFTTEDFRFFWEDVANNSELSPRGPSVELLVDGKPPKVEIVDELTIRYSWDKPNPYFIESQARAAPLFLFRPAHYLKTLHGKYTPEEEILKAHKGSRWANVFRRQDAMYGNDNLDLPTLNAWKLVTPPPSQRFVFERNPFYYRIDEKGVQLPYFDKVIFTVVASNLIPAKAGLGESDLQPRYLGLRDYTFLRDAAKKSGIKVLLWEKGSGSEVAFYPNMNAADETWRKLNRDVRFRRALSLAIDREELSEVVYNGMAKPSANTIMPRSPLFRPELATKWATYDVKAANKLLDEVGLDKKGGDGIRLLPNGQPAIIVVEHTSEKADEVDNMTPGQGPLEEGRHPHRAQGADHRQLPPAHHVRRGDHDRLCRRDHRGADGRHQPQGVRAGDAGRPAMAEMGPATSNRNGKQGEACDTEEGKKLLELLHQWERSTDAAERRKAWDEILAINAEQVFSIGTVNSVRQPLTTGKKVRNVPEKGYWAWDPGGYIGLYKPDTFWMTV